MENAKLHNLLLQENQVRQISVQLHNRAAILLESDIEKREKKQQRAEYSEKEKMFISVAAAASLNNFPRQISAVS